jgi:hypothetical protein
VRRTFAPSACFALACRQDRFRRTVVHVVDNSTTCRGLASFATCRLGLRQFKSRRQRALRCIQNGFVWRLSRSLQRATQAMLDTSFLARPVRCVRSLLGRDSELVVGGIIKNRIGIVSHAWSKAYLWPELATLGFTQPIRPHLVFVIRHPAFTVRHCPSVICHLTLVDALFLCALVGEVFRCRNLQRSEILFAKSCAEVT